MKMLVVELICHLPNPANNAKGTIIALGQFLGGAISDRKLSVWLELQIYPLIRLKRLILAVQICLLRHTVAGFDEIFLQDLQDFGLGLEEFVQGVKFGLAGSIWK